jgi:hypothetical protein
MSTQHIVDFTGKELTAIPHEILRQTAIQVVYFDINQIT